MTESFGALTVETESLAFADMVAADAGTNVDAAKTAAEARSRVLILRLIGDLARPMEILSVVSAFPGQPRPRAGMMARI
jgi:hypothetical protein